MRTKISTNSFFLQIRLNGNEYVMWLSHKIIAKKIIALIKCCWQFVQIVHFEWLSNFKWFSLFRNNNNNDNNNNKKKNELVVRVKWKTERKERGWVRKDKKTKRLNGYGKRLRSNMFLTGWTCIYSCHCNMLFRILLYDYSIKGASHCSCFIRFTSITSVIREILEVIL